jgi:hypothetical protein
MLNNLLEKLAIFITRPFAKLFFKRIAKDIDTDPETAAKFQSIIDAKKGWEQWKKTMEKEYPNLKDKLDEK